MTKWTPTRLRLHSAYLVVVETFYYPLFSFERNGNKTKTNENTKKPANPLWRLIYDVVCTTSVVCLKLLQRVALQIRFHEKVPNTSSVYHGTVLPDDSSSAINAGRQQFLLEHQDLNN